MQQIELTDYQTRIQRNHLDIELQPSFLPTREADALLVDLINTCPWQQPRVKVWGKWHPTPRLVCFYGDPHLAYAYSRTLHGTLAWTAQLTALKQRIEACCSTTFNAVLLNYYRDGQDSIGWHADDEKELGQYPVIASLSLGAERDLRFKPRSGNGAAFSLALPSGSLLLMRGATQQYWLHHLPRRARCHTPRVNLTFRQIKSASS